MNFRANSALLLRGGTLMVLPKLLKMQDSEALKTLCLSLSPCTQCWQLMMNSGWRWWDCLCHGIHRNSHVHWNKGGKRKWRVLLFFFFLAWLNVRDDKSWQVWSNEIFKQQLLYNFLMPTNQTYFLPSKNNCLMIQLLLPVSSRYHRITQAGKEL